MIIAVDFDGTIVEHEYPKIGKEKIFATETLRQLINDGHRLILWTVREGDLRDEAVEWCRKRGVEFYAVNKAFPEEKISKNEQFSRKIKADVWIDDLNIGGLPDWGTIYRIITEKKTLQQVIEEKLVNQLPKPQKKKWWQI